MQQQGEVSHTQIAASQTKYIMWLGNEDFDTKNCRLFIEHFSLMDLIVSFTLFWEIFLPLQSIELLRESFKSKIRSL